MERPPVCFLEYLRSCTRSPACLSTVFGCFVDMGFQVRRAGCVCAAGSDLNDVAAVSGNWKLSGGVFSLSYP